MHTAPVVDHVNYKYSADVDANVGTEVDVKATDVVNDVTTTSPDGSFSTDDSSVNESVIIEDYDVKPTDMPAEGMQHLPDNTGLSTDMVFNLIDSF